MAKFDPFLSLDCARVEGVGRNLATLHLATLDKSGRTLQRESAAVKAGDEQGEEEEEGRRFQQVRMSKKIKG